jgi:hypothetical protein
MSAMDLKASMVLLFSSSIALAMLALDQASGL